MIIRKLTPGDAEAYVEFFDTTPHDDHNPENTCYCVNWCSADHRALIRPDREQRRAMALDYVKNGVLRGYVAIKDGRMIGWCNANTKSDCAYCAGLLFALPDLQRAASKSDERVKAVYCFMIAEEYHRQGISRRLLRAVCEDAEREGFDYVEAYPQKDASVEYMRFMGFDGLYRSEGFERYMELEDKYVVRKPLRS
ncbi:MAG: GNAT family N-acetyltransferase [Lachnospiraceae bacterium]|nr:GNAT family N-acetyltransferase [Ruminococcus sp.]MCM1275023.1 GNAT family N-acetyltransferase [Lachnospiraceae bacterium]